jgi:predicted dehydrogenase
VTDSGRGGDAPIRWGIAATGGIAQGFATGLAELDDAETAAEAFGERFAIPHRHASYEALAEDPDVDVVYVASPHARHEPDTLLFLEAGKHVLCEKPFALNRAQGERMVALARRQQRFLMEAIWSRFLPAYQVLARLLADGTIGDPLVVEADFGFRVPADPAHRLFNRALGGGALLDLGIYPLQLASLVLGPPDDVRAVGQLGETEVDEQVAAVLHHPSGALAVVKAALRTTLACTARIAGSEGSIELPAFMHCPGHVVVTTAAGTERIDAPVEGQGLRYQALEVHRCVRAGLLESPTMPLAETLTLAATMDTVRAQIGVVYPGE